MRSVAWSRRNRGSRVTRGHPLGCRGIRRPHDTNLPKRCHGCQDCKFDEGELDIIIEPTKKGAPRDQ
jgi:hypothetical protein